MRPVLPALLVFDRQRHLAVDLQPGRPEVILNLNGGKGCGAKG